MELKHLINDDLLILFITLQGTEPICRKTGSKLWVTSGNDFYQAIIQWRLIWTQPTSVCSNIQSSIILRMGSWWRHLMEHFPRYWPLVRGIHAVTGEFSSQRPVTRSFDAFFDLHLKRRLNEPSTRRWSETPSRSLWRHYNVETVYLQSCFISM